MSHEEATLLDPLDGCALLEHVSALANAIGPRPPGHPAEERARAYIRQTLRTMGLPEPEAQPFRTPDTWGYALVTPAVLSLAGSVLGRWGRIGAWVGAALVYAAHHGGFSYLSGYTPDAESVALVERTARAQPHVAVTGRRIMILDEIAALRRRGYRGICLVGLDTDGWPANWHRTSDAVSAIEPAALERAARFGLAVLQTLDEESCAARSHDTTNDHTRV